MALAVTKIHLGESQHYVRMHHGHSDPPVGHMVSLAALVENRIVGVAVIGRPTSPEIQNSDPWALEVTRVCVERIDGKGYRNACSFLYGASWRWITANGYLRGITYTQGDETGASIRAAGWVKVASRKPRKSGWDSREGRASGGPRLGGDRYEKRAAAWEPGLPPRPMVEIPYADMDQLALLEGVVADAA